jgi:hypothetical protein
MCIVNGADVRKNKRIGGNVKSGADNLAERANGHFTVTTMRECESPAGQLDIPDVADNHKLRNGLRVRVEFRGVEGLEKPLQRIKLSHHRPEVGERKVDSGVFYGDFGSPLE